MNLRSEGCWDQHYEEELKNFHDHGDQGDVWFGQLLTRRIVDRVLQEIKDSKDDGSQRDINILDVGCGNALLLCTLVDRANKQLSESTVARLQLFGLDYSANSIELSRKIVDAKNAAKPIHLEQCDFLNLPQDDDQLFNGKTKFDFIVDKGTFDAICLLSTNQSVKDNYRNSINALTKPGTILILASCNHTEDELLAVFSNDADLNYRLLGKIETPKLTFGGKEGSQVCCIILSFY